MKSIKFFGILILIISAQSCKGKDKVPGNILSQQEMKIVLEDMMKADQFLSDYVLNRDTSKKKEAESIKLYNEVFALHQITPDKFYKSFTFYQQHPGLLKPILDSLSMQVKLMPVMDIDSINSPAIDPSIREVIIEDN